MDALGPKPGDNEALARQVRAGVSFAFEELTRRLRPGLEAHLARRTAHQDDVDDLVQETFLRVHRGLGGYDPGRPLLPWVLTIASNVAAEAARKRPVRLAAAAEPADPAASAAGEPWRQAAAAERHENIWQTARRILRPREYEALRRHYAEGMPVAAAAKAMRLTKTHVKVLLHRARKRLMEQGDLRKEL